MHGAVGRAIVRLDFGVSPSGGACRKARRARRRQCGVQERRHTAKSEE
jgi:hypothetical protein